MSYITYTNNYKIVSLERQKQAQNLKHLGLFIKHNGLKYAILDRPIYEYEITLMCHQVITSKDVYKRQQIYNVLLEKKLLGIEPKSFSFLSMLLNIFKEYREPVSYTHLDVYKRQGLYMNMK